MGVVEPPHSPGLLYDFSPVSLATLAYLMLTLEEAAVYFDLNFCPMRCLSALLMTVFTQFNPTRPKLVKC